MAENEYVIDISTNANPTSIEELSTLITETTDNANELSSVNVDINTDDALDHLDEMNNLLDEIYGTDEELILDINTEEAVNGLDNAASSASELQSNIDNIDPSNINDVGTAGDNASSGMDNASASSDAFQGALGGVAAMGIIATLKEAASASDKYNQSVGALSTNLGSDALGDKVVSSVGKSAATYGVAGSAARSYANMLAISGVKNEAVFSSMTKNIAGMGYISKRTGETAEAAQNRVTNSLLRVAKSGTISTMALRNMGVSAQDLESAAGMSLDNINAKMETMTEAERWEYLNTLLSNTGKVQEGAAKASGTLETKMNALGMKIGGVTRRLGAMIMPSVLSFIGMLTDGVTGLLDWFDSLPSSAQGVIGTIALVIGVFGILAAGGFAVMKTVSSVQKTFSGFKSAMGICEASKKNGDCFSSLSESIKSKAGNIKSTISGMAGHVKDAIVSPNGSIKTAGSTILQYAKDGLTAGKNAVIGAGKFVFAAATRAGAWLMELPAKISATVSNWALAASEYALLLPLLLVVAAIIAVVAVLWYLYNNNETVRAGIDWLIASFWNFVGMLGQIPAAIQGFVSSGIAWISQLPGRIWMYLIAIIARVASWGANLISNGRNTASKFVTTVVSFFTSLPSKIYNAIKGVVDYFRKVFTDAGMAAYNAMLATPILGDLIRAGGDAIGWLMGTAGGDTAGGDSGYAAGGDFTTASTGYKPPNLDRNINQSSNNGNTYNYYNTNDLKGIIDKDAAEYIIDTITKKTREDLLKIGKVV